MDSCVTADALKPSFNFLLALKSIHDQLVSRDLKAMKFLCTEFIPLQKMEKIRSSLDLFRELQVLRKISPPSDVSVVAELLFCLQHKRLIRNLQYTDEEIGRIFAEGRSQLHPCRVLLHWVSEDITRGNFETMRGLCPDVPLSTLEKIEDSLDLILVLERLNRIQVSQRNLSYMKNLLRLANLDHLAERIECFERNSFRSPLSHLSTGSNLQNISVSGVHGTMARNAPGNQNATFYPTTSLNNTLENLCVSSRTSRDPFQDFQMPENSPAYGRTNKSARAEIMENMPGPHPDVDDILPCYKMTSNPRGICLIISNRSFSRDENGKDLDSRRGTEVDCEKLKQVFRYTLNFDVRVHFDLSDVAICDLMKETAALDHSIYDCFVCCVLSHGVDGAIHGCNGKLVQIKKLTSYFRPSSCHTLFDKPKLFFIQACQGHDAQLAASDIVADGPYDVVDISAAGAARRETIPDEADFLVALSTVPGYLSYRSRTKGTWYITTLVQMIEKYAHREDLLSILVKVNEEISRAEASRQGGIPYTGKQVGMPIVTLRKKVVFF